MDCTLCWWQSFRPAFTGFMNVSSTAAAAAWKSFVLLHPFWGPGMPYWWIWNFLILGKHVFASTIQNQHHTDPSCSNEYVSQWHEIALRHSGRTDLILCTLLQTRETLNCSELETIAVHCFFISLLHVSCTVQLQWLANDALKSIEDCNLYLHPNVLQFDQLGISRNQLNPKPPESPFILGKVHHDETKIHRIISRPAAEKYLIALSVSYPYVTQLKRVQNTWVIATGIATKQLDILQLFLCIRKKRIRITEN